MAGAQSPFVWYELMTSDVAAAKAFYAKIVGWNTQDMPNVGRFAVVADPQGASFALLGSRK